MDTRYFKLVWERMSYYYFLFLFFLAVVVFVKYISVSLAIDRTLSKAEANGCLDYAVMQRYLTKFKVDENSVTVQKAEPQFGTYVNKLGDPIKIEVTCNIFQAKIFGGNLDFALPVRRTGINQGYYGSGY